MSTRRRPPLHRNPQAVAVVTRELLRVLHQPQHEVIEVLDDLQFLHHKKHLPRRGWARPSPAGTRLAQPNHVGSAPCAYGTQEQHQDFRRRSAGIRGCRHSGRQRPLQARKCTETRNPILLFRLSGVLLFRFAERQFCGLLFHEPPRNTRFITALSLSCQPQGLEKTIFKIDPASRGASNRKKQRVKEKSAKGYFKPA